MTGFKPGDRVHVEYDGEVREVNIIADSMWVHADAIGATDGQGGYVRSGHCTLLRPPLAVGDVLTADDPEPPFGTVVRTSIGITFARITDNWHAPSDPDYQKWPKLIGNRTVLYVPEDAS